MTKCDGCGTEKDLATPEVYPYPDDGRVDDRPLSPLTWLDVAPDERGTGYRRAWVCNHCFHKLDPDMWISERCWRSISPAVLFADLPLASQPRRVAADPAHERYLDGTPGHPPAVRDEAPEMGA